MTKLKTYFHSWEINAPKANIVIIHGLGEHIQRYEELAKHFNSQGFGVYGFDHFGHGRSEGKRGHLVAFEDSYDIIDGLISQVKGTVPVFLYGHSMGGNIVLNYMLSRKPKVAGVISSAPFITAGSPISKLLVLIGKLMSSIYPSLQLDNGLDLANLSTDPAVIKAYEEDPHVHSKLSARLGALMLSHADHLNNYSGAFPAPLLLMHGADDIITGPDGTKNFASRISSEANCKIWNDEYHEIHNGKSKKDVWSFAKDWILERI